jgi:starch synthase (maltosyl-transferring)
VLCVVTLNPHEAEEGTVLGAPAAMGAAPGGTLPLRDEISGEVAAFDGATHVKIDPRESVARILVRLGHE